MRKSKLWDGSPLIERLLHLANQWVPSFRPAPLSSEGPLRVSILCTSSLCIRIVLEEEPKCNRSTWKVRTASHELQTSGSTRSIFDVCRNVECHFNGNIYVSGEVNYKTGLVGVGSPKRFRNMWASYSEAGHLIGSIRARKFALHH